jgi:hypothetical protein
MTPPPRLFVIVAAEAERAVVIRRGPASWSQIVLWDTARDVLTPGAWFHGRIYADKCDLSPDGELFVYAAFKGRMLASEYTQSWTAVSRPPWLHALALWPMGTTYGGGGRFVGRRTLILRGAGATHPDHPSTGLEIANGNAELHRSTGEVEGAEWSGRDARKRLIFTRHGCIFARSGGIDLLVSDERTRGAPNPEPPPEWAKAKNAIDAPRRRKSK